MQNPTQNLVVSTATISRTAAQSLVDQAINAADSKGIAISVAVVDAGGALKAFGRTDGALFLTVDAAIDKAWTAASFGLPTHAWNAYLADPKLAPLSTTQPRLLAVGGGLPIHVDGQLVGGVGISGGTYDQDQAVAETALIAAGLTAG